MLVVCIPPKKVVSNQTAPNVNILGPLRVWIHFVIVSIQSPEFGEGTPWLKGALCSFGEEFVFKDFNIDKVITQTQKYPSFP